MPVTRETFGTYMSRLGYLPQDQNMDEGFNISKYHKLHKFVNNHVVLSQAGWWTSEVHPERKHGGYNGDPSASNQVQRFCISGGGDFETFSKIPSTVLEEVYNPLLLRFSWWMNGSPTVTTRRCVKIYLYNKIMTIVSGSLLRTTCLHGRWKWRPRCGRILRLSQLCSRTARMARRGSSAKSDVGVIFVQKNTNIWR